MKDARALLVRLANDLGDEPKEILRTPMPDRDSCHKAPGPWLILPFGLEPKTSRKGALVDARGQTSDDSLIAFLASPRVEPRRVQELTRCGPLWSAKKESQVKDLVDSPSAQAVLAGCSVLFSLVQKAARLGHLAGEERRTLIESLGHLPDNERGPVLAQVLAPTPWSEARTRSSLARLSEFPLGCAKIRTRHAPLCPEGVCGCQFRGLWGGAYATPVLHVLRPDELPIFRQRMRERRAHNRAVERPNPEVSADSHLPESVRMEMSSTKTTRASNTEARPLGDDSQPKELFRGLDENSQPGMAESRANPEGCEQDVSNNSQPGMAESRANPEGCEQDAHNSTLTAPQEIGAPGSRLPVADSVDDQRKGEPQLERFEATLKKLRNLKLQEENVTRGISRARRELDELFDAAGTDRVRLEHGWLVRRSKNPLDIVYEI